MGGRDGAGRRGLGRLADFEMDHMTAAGLDPRRRRHYVHHHERRDVAARGRHQNPLCRLRLIEHPTVHPNCTPTWPPASPAPLSPYCPAC